MSGSLIHIRRLHLGDAALYREIRLEGLERTPEAFGSTAEAEGKQPLSFFAERLGRPATFGAFLATELVGIAGYFVQPGLKEAHKAMLVGMYVRPNARRCGVGTRLVEAILDDAGRHVELIKLAVVSENTAALRLYSHLGFVEYGVERNALKQAGRYYDEVLMARPFACSGDPASAGALAAPAKRSL